MEIYPDSTATPVAITKDFLFASDTLENERGIPVPSIREMFEIFEDRLCGAMKDINWSIKTIEASNMHLSKPANYIPQYDDLGRELPIPFHMANKTITKYLTEWTSDIVFEDEVRLSAIQSVHYKSKNISVTYAIGGNVKRCSNGLITGKYLKKFTRTEFDPDELTLHLRDWVRSHEDVVKEYTAFIKSQKEQYLTFQDINQYVGNMLRNAVIKPKQIIDIKDLLQGVRNINDRDAFFPADGNMGMDKWSLFNNFTEPLKKAELADRADKVAKLYAYFSKV